MRKACAMAGTIFNPEKPKQSIQELKKAGIHEVMFDFGLFASPEWILKERNAEKSRLKPELSRQYYHNVIEEFTSHGFLPSIARLPFVSAYAEPEYDGLRNLICQVSVDCIRACEKIGCSLILVQPLFAEVQPGEEWKVNREYYLKLASQCEKKETRLLLVNQCRNQNGHLMRGICSDAETASEWVDALNREAGQERFGFCLDAGVCNLCGQNMQSMAAVLGKRMQAVILTENDGRRMANLLPFTNAYRQRSTMDWLGLIRGLREAEFDGYLILEMTDTLISFSPLLQPYLVPLYAALLDYFEMQINIENDLKKYKRVALFGAGNMCRNYMKCYGEKYPPLFTCDNNPELWDTEFEGLTVKSPEALKNLPEDCGVILCNIFYREIEAQLKSMGIERIGYFNDEYMPSFYFERLKREDDSGKRGSNEDTQGKNRGL